MTSPTPPPATLLVVLPSWVGDAVMATPAIARIRESWSTTMISLLCRRGIDQLFESAVGFAEIRTFDHRGVLAPFRAAAAVRPGRYDAALLLPNSFSSALIARLAGIPERTGYDRDHRGFLLTNPLEPPRNADGSWTVIPAADYYWNLAAHLLCEAPHSGALQPAPGESLPPAALPADAYMDLPVSAENDQAADELLARAGLTPDAPFAILNPGGNNPAKRWPADRFALVARYLAETHGLGVLVNGSPGEADLCGSIVSQAVSGSREGMAFSLPTLGITLGALKALCRRAAIMVTNDTGPRHIAAAMGTPLVTLFGPTDHRWTTIPVRRHADGSPRETILVADPTLPASESANDHPERCRVDRITLQSVVEAADAQLSRAGRGGA